MRTILIVLIASCLNGCYVSGNINHAGVEPEPVTGCLTDTECENENPNEAHPASYMLEV